MYGNDPEADDSVSFLNWFFRNKEGGPIEANASLRVKIRILHDEVVAKTVTAAFDDPLDLVGETGRWEQDANEAKVSWC